MFKLRSSAAIRVYSARVHLTLIFKKAVVDVTAMELKHRDWIGWVEPGF